MSRFNGVILKSTVHQLVNREEKGAFAFHYTSAYDRFLGHMRVDSDILEFEYIRSIDERKIMRPAVVRHAGAMLIRMTHDRPIPTKGIVGTVVVDAGDQMILSGHVSVKTLDYVALVRVDGFSFSFYSVEYEGELCLKNKG